MHQLGEMLYLVYKNLRAVALAETFDAAVVTPNGSAEALTGS